MSNVPLPRPGPLGLIQYAGVDMLQYAGEVSAAKDAEIAGLRAELLKSLADNAALRAEVAGLREELDTRRRSGSASDRLHNICQAIEAEADSSVFSREEWDRIDAENTAFSTALRSLLTKLEASLRIPRMPWPDPGAHSHETTGRAIHASFCELRFVVMDALETARAAIDAARKGEAC